MLQHTPDERRFLERRAEWRRQRGLPAEGPAPVPEVAEEHEQLWRAFQELALTRGAGFAPERVTCAQVLAWCDLHGIATERRPTFWRVIMSLDAEALAIVERRRKKHDGTAAGD